MLRAVSVVFVSAAIFAAAAPALAQSYPESRVVTYAELDLNSAAGADTLIRRINNASEDVCARHDGRRPLRQAGSDRACEYETTEVAILEVNHPNVSARYFGSGYIEAGAESYDPRLDPRSPEYDPTLDPNAPEYRGR
jgi:UrcA family protein